MTFDAAALRASLTHRLRTARESSDALFGMLAPEAMAARPIPERHRILFYLGHMEAFDWNLLCRSTFGIPAFDATLDRLFAFGIDPVGGGLPDDAPGDWPPVDAVHAYKQRVRSAVDDALARTDFTESDDLDRGLVFEVAVEHRLMHVETLAYMLHWLPAGSKAPPRGGARETGPRRPSSGQVPIPAGAATLGQPPRAAFGWDNEFGTVRRDVAAFAIDRHNVTNGQFLDFVREGGYSDPSLWTDPDRAWLEAAGIRHPRFWEPAGNGSEAWNIRTMFDTRPLPPSWPVYVSHAEASAYARWKGRSLPTEDQFHRAAYGSPGGEERAYPWGGAPPGPAHGNFDFQSWDPAPVGSFPAGDSAFGVADLLGNGWEWTSTLFEPLPGFRRFHFYPGYSADFFDGRHYVMKGGSQRTAAPLLRRSFRNWFQPHYPHIYSTFRLVSP